MLRNLFRVPKLMLPNSKNAPALAPESLSDNSISAKVSFELCRPEFPVFHRNGTVGGTSVPEAAIDEDSKPCSAEHEIRTAEDLFASAPAGDLVVPKN